MLVGVIALCVPLIAVQPVLGFAMLIILVACVRYLGADGGARLPDPRALARRARSSARCGRASRSPATCSAPARARLPRSSRALVVEATGIALGRPMIGATVDRGDRRTRSSRSPSMPDSLLSTRVDRASRSPRWTPRPSRSTIDGFSKISQPLDALPPAVAVGARRGGRRHDRRGRRARSAACRSARARSRPASPSRRSAAPRWRPRSACRSLWEWVALSLVRVAHRRRRSSS